MAIFKVYLVIGIGRSVCLNDVRAMRAAPWRVVSPPSTLDDARTLSLSAHAQILLAGSGGAHGGSTLFLLSFIIIIIIVATATHPLPVLIMAS